VSLDTDLGLFKDVDLDIFLKEKGKPIISKGTTVWIVKRHPTFQGEKTVFDTGIEFREISEKDKVKVSQLVDSLIKSDS